MRFKISHENIEIDPEPEGTESIVLILVGILVPRWTSELFFASQKQSTYPKLKEHSSSRSGLRIVDYEHNVDRILDRFRIVEHDDGLLYVADTTARLTVKDRKAICRQLAQRLR
jgi:hypothetical protein